MGQDASREGGSFVTGQDKFKAQGTQETESVGSAMPKSVVADHDYPNVPERAEPQQAATGPGTGQTVGTEKVPFKDQVQGYAKSSTDKFSVIPMRKSSERRSSPVI